MSDSADEMQALRAQLARSRLEASALRAELQEKELLLAELGHRAGNNLQAIIALIRFAARAIAEPEARRRVEDLAERVAKIGLIHRLLGEAGHGPGLDAEFLGELAEAVRATYGADGVELVVTVEPIMLKPSAAVALGLLVNEALSNAFKHAFAAVEQPRVEVSLRRAGAAAELVIQDNGSGPGPAREGSMGMQLMATLARQMRGAISVEEHGGTRVAITAPFAAIVSQGGTDRPEPAPMRPLAPGFPVNAAASR